MATLNSNDSSVLKKRFELGKAPVIIGRHPECDIHIDDGSVSRHHAQVTFESGQYYLQDLNSRNGTYLNNQPIHRATKLYDHSEIRICEVTLAFSISANPGSQIAPRPTFDTDSQARKPSTNSVLLEDFGDDDASKVMSQFDIPSHHSRTNNHVTAEEKLLALTKITHALSETVDRDEILAKILDFLFDLFTEADRGFLILKAADGTLQPLGVKTRRPGDDEMIRVSRTIVNQVITTKRPLISSDAATDDRFDMSQSIVDFRIRSIMCAPLINSKDEAIGVIQLDTLKQSIAFKEEDLETLVTVAMQASLAIQKSDLFQESKNAENLRTDLELAHEIQQRFLPQRSPATDHFDFFSYYRPMQQVGGDYFDYVQLENNKIGVIVADVVGHGVAAALLMAKVSAESRFALATSKTAVEAISKMNNSLSGMNIDRFVTLVLGLLDLNTNQMTIVNAGHMPPILRKSSTGEISQLAIEESGLPLGIMEEYEYESITVDLEPGDLMLMYTDGINEAMDSEGNQLSTNRMIEEIRQGQAKTPEAVGNQVCEIVARHAGLEPAIDDMCLVCIGRQP
ncbi:MAG: sigma-B regulation protein RsbU (phosphoserine phosphatase) [Mariniblastus sp.]|jgi:sigma-B regulation protein RsbU (phosphoserine phosphatase)